MTVYEIWGGDLGSLSYYEGGLDMLLESCDTLEEAKKLKSQYQYRDYVAYIKDENGSIIS